MALWDALATLPTTHVIGFFLALAVAFGFEVINGFHDTANAVTTVIYTNTLKPTPAVIYSGFMNFLGVLTGGTAVAFSIVHLLPVDILIESSSTSALVMVMSLLLSGVIWNLGTWYRGLPVSSSHTLIGSILGVGLANSLLAGNGVSGVNWGKALEVFEALLFSPIFGFGLAAILLLLMRQLVPDPRLYEPPPRGHHSRSEPEDQAVPDQEHAGDNPHEHHQHGKHHGPPKWIRGVLLSTCGAVSFAHGSNDGQKGMGLILLVLIGFLPFHYALNTEKPELAREFRTAVVAVRDILKEHGELAPALETHINALLDDLQGKHSLADIPDAQRWEIRQSMYRFEKESSQLALSPEVRRAIAPHLHVASKSIEFVPLWVVVGVALSLGIGTTIGYKRIVVTVAEKIGKTHLTYAQGAAAEITAAATILGADVYHLPVSTTHVLSSGVAGSMVANGSGVQGSTIRTIALAWALTLPAAMLLAGLLFVAGKMLFAQGS